MSSASDDSVAAIALAIKDERRPAVEVEPARRQQSGRSQRAPPIEIAFLESRGVPLNILHYAAGLARRQGVYADEVLLAEGLLDEQTYYRALADHLGVVFLDGAVDVTPESLDTFAQGYAPLVDTSGGLKWLFAPTGAGVAWLIGAARAPHGAPLFAVTTRSQFVEAVRRAVAADVLANATASVERVSPELCVRPCLSQEVLARTILAFALLVLLLFAPSRAMILIAALPLAAAFLASVFLRLLAYAASFEADDRQVWIDDARLPVYTVIIALHKEASIAQQLSAAIDRLDYPVLWRKRHKTRGWYPLKISACPSRTLSSPCAASAMT